MPHHGYAIPLILPGNPTNPAFRWVQSRVSALPTWRIMHSSSVPCASVPPGTCRPCRPTPATTGQDDGGRSRARPRGITGPCPRRFLIQGLRGLCDFLRWGSLGLHVGSVRATEEETGSVDARRRLSGCRFLGVVSREIFGSAPCDGRTCGFCGDFGDWGSAKGQKILESAGSRILVALNGSASVWRGATERNPGQRCSGRGRPGAALR